MITCEIFLPGKLIRIVFIDNYEPKLQKLIENIPDFAGYELN